MAPLPNFSRSPWFWAIIFAWYCATWRNHWKNEVVPMDYERCAELHNRILDLGTRKQLTLGDGGRHHTNSNFASPWHLFKKPAPPVLKHPNWFERWGKRAEAMRPWMSPDLAAFLERAGDPLDDGHHFFYYVGGLASPDYLFGAQAGWAQDPKDRFRYVTLYMAGYQFTHHPDGLIFDQKKSLAIMQMDIMDSFTTQNGRQKWYPLEVVLAQWLDMIDVGKIQAVPDGTRTRSEKIGPWTMVGYSERQLEETLEVWEQLVSAIEARIPGFAPSDVNSTRTLFDDDEIDLEAAGVLPGFVSEFLTKARRPAFRHIAPGLRLRDAEPMAFQQPFRHFPVLLFDSSEELTYDAPPSNKSPYLDRHATPPPPFGRPWSDVPSYQAGLYFTETDQGHWHTFEDGVKLVLPFGIGSRGYARTADGALFGENTEQRHGAIEGRDRHDALFQLGYQPFGADHEVRLVQVLWVWVRLVESGAWKVGPDGVLGGMQKWRDADTWWYWKKYVVPMSW
ncbi:hypothetical protein PG985_007995 [Apiospora marii]|uniref:uncharacterized protein n=1 Tax=Apiospora marii TaxID=335849 RepID=UPI0031305EF9